MNTTLDILRAEQARINADILAATADAFADAIRQAAREAGREPTRIAVEFWSDDDGGHWPGMRLVLDDPDVADQLDGDINDWPQFKDWCDALMAVDGREALFGRTIDLTDAGTTATNHVAGDDLHAALLPVAAHLDVPVDAITSVSWLTIGIDGQPVHLHVTYDGTGAWADEVVDDETYVYPDDGDVWHDAVALAAHLFDGDAPHDQWEDHRYEWTWHRHEPTASDRLRLVGDGTTAPAVRTPAGRDALVRHLRHDHGFAGGEPGGEWHDPDAGSGFHAPLDEWDADHLARMHDDDHVGYEGGSGTEHHHPAPDPADRVVWAARSDKARKQAITAVTVLRPDLNRTQAADVLRDTHPDAWAPGKDDVLAVAEAYSSDRVQTVHAAVAALVDRLGRDADVLSPANPVDGAAWVHAAGYGVGMQLADGREASVHAPSQDRDTGRVSGGWSQLAIIDGGRIERLVDTGLPVECSDPLRVAKAVVKAVGRLLDGD